MEYKNDKIKQLLAERNAIIEKYNLEIKNEIAKEKAKYKFNWKLFLKDHPCNAPIKDVNDFILHNTENIEKLTYPVLEKYFTNNVINKIYFI
jgi:hypothetical protein